MFVSVCVCANLMDMGGVQYHDVFILHAGSRVCCALLITLINLVYLISRGVCVCVQSPTQLTTTTTTKEPRFEGEQHSRLVR